VNCFYILESVCSEVLANHTVLVYHKHVSILDTVKFLFKLIDVFFFSQLHLSHNLLLGVKLSVKVLCFRKRLVHLVLILQVLLIKELNLFLSGHYLDVTCFHCQNLVFEIAFDRE
jgi:hypothetical protein